jgi:hypothetical protein
LGRQVFKDKHEILSIRHLITEGRVDGKKKTESGSHPQKASAQVLLLPKMWERNREHQDST